MGKQQSNKEKIKEFWQSLKNDPEIKDGIDSVTYDDEKFHIRFKDGYRLEYKHQYLKEISLSGGGLWSILNHINKAKESDFLMVEEKLEELSAEAKEKIELVDYHWAYTPYALPDLPFVYKLEKRDVAIWLKKGWFNTFQFERPSSQVRFNLDDLRNGEHLEAMQEKYFVKITFPWDEPNETEEKTNEAGN